MKQAILLNRPIPSTPPLIQHTYSQEVQFYHNWLVKHVTRSYNPLDEQQYQQEASAIYDYHGKPVWTFAPLRAERSAVKTWTPAQITVLCILLAVTIVCGVLFGISTLTAIFAVVTTLYVALLALSVAWIIGTSRPTPPARFDERIIDDLRSAPWPSYTILCPLYREATIVPQFVEAMRELDYPADCLQVLFLTEQDDQETRDAIGRLRLPSNFQVLTVPPGTPRTKPRACNYGLLHARGEYVVIYDAEDVPDPLQLKKAVLTFASSPVDTACVQARLNFYNPYQNVLTRWFTVEYSLWFDLILPGLERLGFSLPLGGTSNHFRTSMLRHIGGWDAFNVTEDCDMGLRLAQYDLKTVVLDSSTMEEANSQPVSWVKQRSRWIKGYMQTYLVHTRHLLRAVKQGKIKDLLSLHFFVGVGSLILLVNPVMWAMFVAYLLWRPVALYHVLFPWPVLYAGMGCFLLGNFLPIYASMAACVKREQYALVKWCLLLPLYWVMASVAAFLAAYELIVKPHVWHKTQHGLHLKGRSTGKVLAVTAAQAASVQGPVAVARAVTASMRAMPTVLMPALGAVRHERKPLDRWVCTVVGFAVLCGFSSTVYYFLHHDILLYGDAYTHMAIARSVIDAYTPGLAQLGGVWLPLPHLLMIPFIWNDFLWQTGLAGSIPSLLCYVVAALFLFLAARRFTGSNSASFAGVLAFLLNPNVLYLQSTPLSEPVCFATFAFASYYFIMWVQEEQLKYLVLAALGAFLSSIARYDGWFLFASMFVLIAVIGVMRRQRRQQIVAYLLMVGALGGAGIFLWFAWNKIIFGDPLYFQHGVYSSQAQMQYFYAHAFGARDDLLLSIKEYSIAIIDTFGSVLPALALLAIGYFFLRKGNFSTKLAALILLSPLAFYAFSFFSGQVVIMVPGFSPYIFNARFGTEAALPIAFFVAILASIRPVFPRHFSVVVPIVFIGIILLQSVIVARGGIVSLEDGQYGLSCNANNTINTYLAQHYNGGIILEDSYLGSPNEGPEVGIPQHRIINQGSGLFWKQALKKPGAMVDWVLIGLRASGSRYPVQVNTSAALFKSQFALVVSDQSAVAAYQLFVRKGLSLPNNPVPARLINEYPYCGTGRRP